jgi:hypothetical protein
MTINNYQDIIDSRGIIERIKELLSEREILEYELGDLEDLKYELGDSMTDEDKDRLTELREWVRDGMKLEDIGDQEDLEALQSLAVDIEGITDWKYGATLIRESYFQEYARELAEEIGAINSDESWPLNHIDWDDAADDLATDYESVYFDGVEYLVRG